MRLMFCCLVLAAGVLTTRAAERPPAELAPEPYALHFSPRNAGDAGLVYAVQAGTIWRNGEGERFVVLCSAEMAMEPHTSAGLTVPAAALSPAAVWKPGQPLARDAEREPRLEPLLRYLSKRNDIPRETSQLAVLALIANSNFADWQKFSAANLPPAAPPANTELSAALDAVIVLKAIAPEGNFALVSDGALKLRALHDPLLRPKALQLYGLTVPGDAPTGAAAPDLGQLLHTKPGDNCPICQMRAQMQKPADVP